MKKDLELKPNTKVDVTDSEVKRDITKIIGECIYWMDKKPVVFDYEIEERLIEFFTRLSERGELPTVEKMAVALGYNVKTVLAWEHDAKRPNRAAMIGRAKAIICALDSEFVLNGKMPVVAWIFRAKNFYGMRDESEVIVTPHNPLGENVDTKQLIEGAELLPD